MGKSQGIDCVCSEVWVQKLGFNSFIATNQLNLSKSFKGVEQQVYWHPRQNPSVIFLDWVTYTSIASNQN